MEKQTRLITIEYTEYLALLKRDKNIRLELLQEFKKTFYKGNFTNEEINKIIDTLIQRVIDDLKFLEEKN